MDKSRQLQNTIDMEKEERRIRMEGPSAARSWGSATSDGGKFNEIIFHS